MALNFIEDWPEGLSLVLMVLGFLVAILANSVLLQYVIILLAGLVFGRLLHRWKAHKKSSLFLLMAGFLLGYMIGGIKAHAKILVFMFFIGVWVGWYFQKRGWIKTATFT